MIEDLGPLFLRQILEDRHGVVGHDVAHAFRHRLRRQLFENFLAHRIVDLGQRGEVEVDAEQFDQPRAMVGIERFQPGAEIGFVQVAHQTAQGRRVGGVDRARDLPDKGNADRAVLGTQRRYADYFLGHAGPGRGTVKRAAFTPGQMISAYIRS